MKQQDTTVEDALRSRSFDCLSIKRIDRDCYLVVTIAGSARVLTDRIGRHKTFRHAWQIREWLENQFQIASGSIPVETYR